MCEESPDEFSTQLLKKYKFFLKGKRCLKQPENNVLSGKIMKYRSTRHANGSCLLVDTNSALYIQPDRR